MRRESSDANPARRIADDACCDAPAERDTLAESLASAEAEVERGCAEADTLRAELEKRGASDGVRRHVMAELSALAASTGTEGWRP